jgi:hypothetical protein
MLSGYSTRMMDLFLTGSMEELQNECDKTNTDVHQSVNTLSLMEKVFSHEMFKKYNDEINNVVKSINVPRQTETQTQMNPLNEMEQITSMFSQMFNINPKNTTVDNNLDDEVDDTLDNDLDDEVDDDLDDTLDENLNTTPSLQTSQTSQTSQTAETTETKDGQQGQQGQQQCSIS